MATSRQGGAIVLEQESPWTQFLGGFGQGVSHGIQRSEQLMDKKKQDAQALMAGILNGTVDARSLGTAPGREMLKSMGLDSNPGIQEIINRGQAELPPDVAHQAPVPGPTVSLPSATNPELGGYAVNMPGKDVGPTAKQVNDIVLAEDTQKKLAVYEYQRKISSAETRLNADHANDLRIGNMLSYAEQFASTMKVLKQTGLGFDDVSWRGNDEGGLSWGINPAAARRLMDAQTNKRGTSYTKFETVASTFNEKRMGHVTKLSTFLATDRVDEKSMALDSNDPESNYYITAMKAINNEPDKNKRVALQVEQVEKIVKQLNENIKQYRRVIQASGDEAKAEQADITDRFTKEITFEDVSGGLSPEEYKKRKGLVPDPGKLISDVRKDYSGNSIVSPRFSESSAKDAATKVSDSFKDIKDIVASAFKDNPSITPDQVKQVMVQNKDQIMAEYGLNEKLFSLLMSMSDKVLA